MRRLIALMTTILILGFISIEPTNAQAMSGGMYDDLVPSITWTGAWIQASDANAYGGSRKTTGFTTSTAFSLDFDFWGDGFVLYILRNVSGGDANVCVNAVCVTLNFYAASPTYTSITYPGYGYGTHSVTITKTSTTSSFLSIDAIFILPPAPAPTVLPPTPIVVITMIYPTVGTQVVNVGNWDEATIEVAVEITEDPIRSSWDIDSQPVAFDYEIDAGQIVMVSLLVVILVVMLIMLWALFSGVTSK